MDEASHPGRALHGCRPFGCAHGKPFGLAGVVLLTALLSLQASAAGRTLAVATTEHGPAVTADEAASYDEAVAEALGAIPDVKVLERGRLKTVLDERDIALAFGPDEADGKYAASAKGLGADEVVVPTLSKVENDYLLGLRLVSVATGATRACTVHRTRLVDKFPAHAQRQVQELLGDQAPVAEPAEGEQAPMSLEALRQACQQAGAETLFPALWKRCQELSVDSRSGSPARLAHYYMTLLNFCARAKAPPQGMVFIPGGYVEVDTAEGPRRLWVEPFFMDRCEVTVAQYGLFAAAASATQARNLLSITRNDRDLNAPALPVTGITHDAATAYAQAHGKALPTMLQWLRAAYGDDGREYPCGDAERLAGCRLKTSKAADGPLTPAAGATLDQSPFGVFHLTGNVREWTGSWYNRQAYVRTPADRPEEPSEGAERVVKGGSWRTDGSAAARKAFDKLKPTEAFDDVGFRCVVPFFLGNVPAPWPASKPGSGQTRN